MKFTFTIEDSDDGRVRMDVDPLPPNDAYGTDASRAARATRLSYEYLYGWLLDEDQLLFGETSTRFDRFRGPVRVPDHRAAIDQDVRLGKTAQDIRDEIIAAVGMMAAARTLEMQARYDAAVARENTALVESYTTSGPYEIRGEEVVGPNLRILFDHVIELLHMRHEADPRGLPTVSMMGAISELIALLNGAYDQGQRAVVRKPEEIYAVVGEISDGVGETRGAEVYAHWNVCFTASESEALRVMRAMQEAKVFETARYLAESKRTPHQHPDPRFNMTATYHVEKVPTVPEVPPVILEVP